MPSLPLLLNSGSNSSNSSTDDLKIDHSDDDDDDQEHNPRNRDDNNEMLERPSDHDDSSSQSDDTNDEKEEEEDEEKVDILTSSNRYRSPLNRQLTLYDDTWPKMSSSRQNRSIKSNTRGEATLLDTERDETPEQSQTISLERSKPMGIIGQQQQSRSSRTSIPRDLDTSILELHAIPEPDNMQSASPLILSSSRVENDDVSASTMRTTQYAARDEQRPSASKIPLRSGSSSQSRSRSPAAVPTHRRIKSPASSSRIPVPIKHQQQSSLPTMSNGAFRFFTADDRPPSSQLPSQQSTEQIVQQISPFTPITRRKTLPSPTRTISTTKTFSSAGNTPSAMAKKNRAPVPSSDDDEESEMNTLAEAELKLKLKEQKRQGKKTGELLNQLHENYGQLLQKYAQAENTIDQLRFQPRIFGDNTPTSNGSEGTIHYIQHPKTNMTTGPSSGVYYSTTATPVSSIRPVGSTTTTTTTTTTTPARKSTSPTNSGTIESVFFDEPIPQQIIVQELTTPETIKLDLLIQTKTLSDKMKSFLTLMDANQLSLAEQKQVYESIKQDYEKLLKALDRTKQGPDLNDMDVDTDLDTELETMKQLLKEIVKRITENLLGKSVNGSEHGGHGGLTRDGSHSSQQSVRSSLCNHGDLMDQYQKLLGAVNAGVVDKTSNMKSLPTGLETVSDQLRKSHDSNVSSRLNMIGRPPPATTAPKPYVYVSSGNSDDEQQSRSETPEPILKRTETIANKRHQQLNEEQTHVHGSTMTKKVSVKREAQDYDNLENVSKGKKRSTIEQSPLSMRKMNVANQGDKDSRLSSPFVHQGPARYSSVSMRTRTSDYDSGIGTNTTKLSRDSKLNTSTMDESHYQSLDEDARREPKRYSEEEEEEEQESISSVVSSRSSGSGAANPGSPYSKYTTKRFDSSLSSSSLKRHSDNYRRKPSGHSDVYPSDIETHVTGSFDPLPQISSNKTRLSYHTWQPRHTISQRDRYRSRITSRHRLRRSVSNDSLEIHTNNFASFRPQTAPLISSSTTTATHHHRTNDMNRQYQSGFIHQSSSPMYRSSFYADQAHTHRRSQERQQQLPLSPPSPQPAIRKRTYMQQSTHLFLDPRTGTIYRYMPNSNPIPTLSRQQPYTQVTSTSDQKRCALCGSTTTYNHRHYTSSTTRRITTDLDDAGYESGHKRTTRRRRYAGNQSSSDSDSDANPSYIDMATLNETYERAKKVQHRSQNLSRHIARQLKLVLATV